MSDGLVTNVSLVIGMAGAHPAQQVVQLAGLAGLIAGACSMAMGELVSMQAQRELLERELEVERREIRDVPDAELKELSLIYQRRGLGPDLAHEVATVLMRNEQVAVETHAREELGIDPDSLGSPYAAATASFASFALGAAVPLVPWLVLSGRSAFVASIVATALLSLVVGGALARFTGRSVVRAAFRQLGLAAVATTIAFTLGLVAGQAGLR